MTHSNIDAIRQALSTGVFFMTEQSAAAYLPTAIEFLKGNIQDYPYEKEPWRNLMNAAQMPKVLNGCYTPQYTYGVGWSFPDLSQEMNGICVLPMNGVIMKSDGWCSHGMLTFVDWLRLAESTDGINSIVIRCDSPGGDAQICEYVERQMSMMSKPILVHTHGLMCSAAYFINSPADKIYCESPSDLVGCIGSMVTLLDYKAKLVKEGIPVHEIYADGSDNKNIQYRKAMEGDYVPYKEKYLNPLKEQFHNVVMKNRPQVATDALSGDSYFAKDAASMGLIDGVQPYSATLAEAYNLGLAYSTTKF